MNHSYETSTRNPNVGGAYTPLNHTYGGDQALMNVGVGSVVKSMATQVVPIDKSLRYESLTHGTVPSSANYFSIEKAFPMYQNNCTQFALRRCDGVLGDKLIQKPSCRIAEGFVRSV